MEARPHSLPPQKELSCALAHDGGYPLIRWHSSSLFLPHPPPPSADGDGLLFANEGENSSTSIIPYADSRKADGICHRLSCYPVFPNAACPRRLCQPPWTQLFHGSRFYFQAEPPLKKQPPQNASYSSGGGPGEALLLEKRPPPAFHLPYSLFGREREGGASRREAASLAITPLFCTFLRSAWCGGTGGCR